MPPRFAYWTIIAGGQPTAFRAAVRDELLPTLKQLQSKEPDAVLMWFSRGKLWPSQEAAWMAQRMERERSAGRERRGSDWRPGGEHKDPRDRFKVPRDVKRQRFAANRRRDRMEEQGRDEAKARPSRPAGDRPSKPAGDRPTRPAGDRPTRPAGDRSFKPSGGRPAGPAGDRPFRPRQDRPQGERQFRPKPGAAGARPIRPKGPRGPDRGQPGGGFRGGGNRGGRGGRGSR